jgi:NADH-quinone oxidoreductase subunit M
VGFAIQAALIAAGIVRVSGTNVSHLVSTQHTGWFGAWNIHYDVALDASALGLVSLVALVTVCACLFAWLADRPRPATFQGLLWLSAACLNGLFVARDLVLFYVFFELMLVPLLLLVGGWGGERRLRAAITMFVYTLLGSLPMLVGIIKVGLVAKTFSLDGIALQAQQGTLHLPWWCFASFVFAFAVKAPLLPLNGWLPLAYREAPIEVTAVLSGLVSKAAMFGMLAVVLPIFPSYMSNDWGRGLTWIAIASLLYASITAFRQPDVRGIIAYSSMAQMGLIFLGLSVVAGPGSGQGLAGAYMQTVNHGLISATLFLICGVVELRAGTGLLRKLGGLASGRPRLATIAMITTMCALAVPGSNAFAGELMIIAGTFRGNWSHAWLWAAIASLAIVLAAMYALRALSAMMHTPEADTPELSESVRGRFGADLGLRELVFLVPLVLALLALSVWPNMLRRAMNEQPVQISALGEDQSS